MINHRKIEEESKWSITGQHRRREDDESEDDRGEEEMVNHRTVREGRRWSLFITTSFTRLQDIYLQLRIWALYLMFSIAVHVITRVYSETFVHLKKLLALNWNFNCVLNVDAMQHIIHFSLTNCGFELALFVTLILQMHQVSNCTLEFFQFHFKKCNKRNNKVIIIIIIIIEVHEAICMTLIWF